MRILLTGADGQIGTEFRKLVMPPGQIIALGKQDLDLGNEDEVRRIVHEVNPKVIVNAGAFNAVDEAERDWDLCFRVNAIAPGILAAAAVRTGALLIHYSTDYVFDGSKVGPYVEEDPTSPLSVYGASKVASERAILSTSANALILRTSWVYSMHDGNFLPAILKAAKQNRELLIVDDQIGAPTSARSVAKATAQLIQKMNSSQRGQLSKGIFHLTARGWTSWCGFAAAIVRNMSFEDCEPPAVTPIASSEYPKAAKRPKNSVLSGEKLHHVFGMKLKHWQDQLQEVMADVPEDFKHAVHTQPQARKKAAGD